MSNDWGCNDTGNKDRFVKKHQQNLKYLRDANHWIVWGNSKWKDNGSKPYEKAQEVSNSISREATDCQDTNGGKQQLLRWAAKSLDKGRLDSMIALAQEPLGVSLEQFDSEHTHINCLNGYLDLRTKEIAPHEASQLVMKQTPVEYDPTATCRRWENFLGEIFLGDQELIDYLQQALGYSMTGLISEHCFWVLFGNGRNGKGIFSDVVERILGDYATTADFKTFLDDKPSDVRVLEQVGNLKGVRFAAASESDRNAKFNEARVKNLTGGDKRIGAKLHAKQFQYTPTDKLWLRTNYLPRIADATVAMWSRVIVVPFANQFLGDDQDKGLFDRLLEEKKGIFAWMVEGAFKYLQAGRLPELPEVCREAVQKYQNDNDQLRRFILDVLEPKPGHTVGAQETYREYERWCEAHNEPAVSQRYFGDNLAERDIKSKRTKAGMVFIDYTIKPRGGIDLNLRRLAA